MADERSPLLQNGQEYSGQTDYLAAADEHDPATINDITHESTDAEQQTVVAPQNSLIALVRLAIFAIYVPFSPILFRKR